MDCQHVFFYGFDLKCFRDNECDGVYDSGVCDKYKLSTMDTRRTIHSVLGPTICCSERDVDDDKQYDFGHQAEITNYSKENKKMKKLIVVVGLLMIPALFVCHKVMADGTYSPALVVNTSTNQNFLYSTLNSSQTAAGVLVNSGGGTFNWSNAPVASTTTSTSLQFPGLTSLTVTQIQGASGIIPAATGQLVMCSNCTSSFVCLSTGSANAFQWIALSSSTTSGQTVCK